MQASFMLWSMNYYLILAIHASLDLTTLNEGNDFPFDLLDTPTKRRCHAVKADCFEWLEVEYDGCLPQMLSDVVHVNSEVYVYTMSCLFQQYHDISVRIKKKGGEGNLTEYLERISSVFLKSLDMYACMRSRTYASCSMYAEKTGFRRSCALMAERERLARAQIVP